MYLQLIFAQLLGVLPQAVITYLVVRVAVHQEMKKHKKNKRR